MTSCPYPYTGSDCTDTYASSISTLPYFIPYLFLSLTLFTFVTLQFIRLLYHRRRLSFQHHLYLISWLIALSLIIRCMDIHRWKDMMPQVVEELINMMATAGCCILFLYCMFSWLAILNEISGHNRSPRIQSIIAIFILFAYITLALTSTYSITWLSSAVAHLLTVLICTPILVFSWYYGMIIYSHMSIMEQHARVGSTPTITPGTTPNMPTRGTHGYLAHKHMVPLAITKGTPITPVMPTKSLVTSPKRASDSTTSTSSRTSTTHRPLCGSSRLFVIFRLLIGMSVIVIMMDVGAIHHIYKAFSTRSTMGIHPLPTSPSIFLSYSLLPLFHWSTVTLIMCCFHNIHRTQHDDSQRSRTSRIKHDIHIKSHHHIPTPLQPIGHYEAFVPTAMTTPISPGSDVSILVLDTVVCDEHGEPKLRRHSIPLTDVALVAGMEMCSSHEISIQPPPFVLSPPLSASQQPSSIVITSPPSNIQ